jgi:peroxiredoxin
MNWPWPAPEDDGGARHLVRGLRLPDVALPSTQGGTVSLAREGSAVAFFYPWTGRPGTPNPPGWDAIPGAHGSTPEAEDFRNLHSAFAHLPMTVYGISSQTPEEQQELAARLHLPYPLLSDATFELASALRLPTFVTGGRTYLKRLTLVIREGRIRRNFYPVHPPHAHAREVLAWLTAAGTYRDESQLRSARP